MKTITTVQDVKDMARGAVFLGSGGGGDPYVGELLLQQQLSEGKFPTIVHASELGDDDFVISIAGIGAPTVLLEYLVSEKTLLRLLELVAENYGKKPTALISAEMGGVNSIFPLALAAKAGLPVVDADGMGRAFPHLEMTSFSVYGCLGSPAILIDEFGNEVIIKTPSDRLLEDMCRAVTTTMGAMVMSAIYPMTGAQVKAVAVQDTITQTLEIGRCIREGRESDDTFAALMDYLNDPANQRYGKVLFEGKITDITHETRDGWHFGKAVIAALDNSNDRVEVDIQNEYLVVRKGGSGETLAIAPDLICILDRENAEPLTAEMLAYGLRVKVIGYSAAPIMRRPECLEVFGPRIFGYDEDFIPVEDIESPWPHRG